MQKEKVRQVLDACPEEVNIDALMEKLYLLQKIEIAERELANDEGVPDEEVEQKLGQWLR